MLDVLMSLIVLGAVVTAIAGWALLLSPPLYRAKRSRAISILNCKPSA